jgi:hypothetical protein
MCSCQADSYAGMSWNLIIYKTGNTSQQVEPLGNLNRVTDALNAAFIDLEWESPIAAALPVEGGFRMNLAVQDRTVQEVYVDGGFNHIRQFAGLCKREGWRMSDVQEGMDVHLDDPQRRYKERSARTTDQGASGAPAAPVVNLTKPRESVRGKMPFSFVIPALYAVAALALLNLPLNQWFAFHGFEVISWPASHLFARESLFIQSGCGVVQWAIIGLLADIIWRRKRKQ